MADTPWYIYHQQGGKIVLHKAQHMAHLKQAMKAAGQPPVAPVAATLAPLTSTELAAFSKHYNQTMPTTAEPELPAYNPPSPLVVIPTWRMMQQIKNAAKAAAPSAAPASGAKAASS